MRLRKTGSRENIFAKQTRSRNTMDTSDTMLSIPSILEAISSLHRLGRLSVDGTVQRPPSLPPARQSHHLIRLQPRTA